MFKLNGEKYVRNTLDDTGRKWASTVVMWGGINTQADAADTQHIAGADFSFDYLEVGDYIAVYDGSASSFKLYLGKTEEGGTVTYWFAENGSAKVGHTAAEAATYLANADHFAVIRPSNYFQFPIANS